MKKAPLKPLATFRLYPAGRYFYALVNIWPTKKAMYAHRPLQRDHDAACTGISSRTVYTDGTSRKNGFFAELNFYKGYIGIGAVSHELTHAAFNWAERVGLCLNTQTIKESNNSKGVLPEEHAEERFCYAIGDMVKQFTVKCYKLGLYK